MEVFGFRRPQLRKCTVCGCTIIKLNIIVVEGGVDDNEGSRVAAAV